MRLYGIDESANSDDAAMFDLARKMRTRFIGSPVFNGDRILATILFAQTMDRTIAGIYAASST